MYDHQLFLRTLSGFAGQLLSPYDVDETLHQLAEQATEILGVLGGGVSLMDGDELRFATAVPESVAPLEYAQEAAQQGPCVHACRTGQIVAIGDLSEVTDLTRDWVTYRATAAELGIGAVAGIPMRLNDQTVGALNLYATGARPWPTEDLAAVHVLADMCTGLLINASQARQQQQLTEQLQQALESRLVIEQAKGIIAQSREEGIDQAFDRIRRHARNRNATLRSVANAIVHLGLRV